MRLQQFIKAHSKALLIGAGVIVGVFAVLNVAAWAYLQERVYPGVQVANTELGMQPVDEAAEVLEQRAQNYQPRLLIEEQSIDTTPEELGINLQIDATVEKARQKGHQSTLPVIGLVDAYVNETVTYAVSTNDEQLNNQLDELEEQFGRATENAQLTFEDEQVAVQPGQPGTELNKDLTKQHIQDAVSQLDSEIDVRFIQVEPRITEEELRQHILEEAIAKTQLELVLTAPGEETFTPSAETKFSWFNVQQPDDADVPQLTVHEDRVSEYAQKVASQVNQPAGETVVTRRGGEVINEEEGQAGLRVLQEELTARLANSLQNNEGGEISVPVESVEPEVVYRNLPPTNGNGGNGQDPPPQQDPNQPQVTYTYCIGFRGVSRSQYYGAFSSKANSTLNASIGWSLDGRIRFSEVSSGCSFDLILATPEEVDALASYCSPQWSCRVGRIAAINVERWNNDTQSWTASLSAYRTMVINHEVGHWLGLDHRSCPGSGALAPVMQQQSISMDGCQPNPWPLESERQRLEAIRGIN